MRSRCGSAVAHPVLDRWAKRFGLPLCLQAVGDLGQKMQQGLASVLEAVPLRLC